MIFDTNLGPIKFLLSRAMEDVKNMWILFPSREQILTRVVENIEYWSDFLSQPLVMPSILLSLILLIVIHMEDRFQEHRRKIERLEKFTKANNIFVLPCKRKRGEMTPEMKERKKGEKEEEKEIVRSKKKRKFPTVIRGILLSKPYVKETNYTDMGGWTISMLREKAKEYNINNVTTYTQHDRKKLAALIRAREQLLSVGAQVGLGVEQLFPAKKRGRPSSPLR